MLRKKKIHSMDHIICDRNTRSCDILRESILRGNRNIAPLMRSADPDAVARDDVLVRILVGENALQDAVATRLDPSHIDRLLSMSPPEDMVRMLISAWIRLSITRDDPMMWSRILERHPRAFLDFASFIKDAGETAGGRCTAVWRHMSQARLDSDIFSILRDMSDAGRERLLDVVPHFLHMKDKHDNTLHHYAVMEDRIDLVACFMKRGLNLNHKNMWALTPLNEAVRLGFSDMSDFLRDNGASLMAVKDSNQSIIGKRRDFFHLLEDLMEVIPSLFPGEDVLLQLFHSVPDKSQLYCCSLQAATEAMKDLANYTRHIIFDSRNVFFFRRECHTIDGCDTMTQQEFFLSPLCQDAGVSSIWTRPYHHGPTLLGYFVLWSKRVHMDILDRFLGHFLARRWAEAVSVFPPVMASVSRLPRFKKLLGEMSAALKSPDSTEFIRAIRFFTVLPDVPDETRLLLRTHLDCHIPFSRLSSEMYDLVRLFGDTPSPSPSFLLEALRRIVVPATGVATGGAPIPLTSFHLFEVIGDHPFPKTLLTEVNRLIADPPGDARSLWDRTRETLFPGSVYREDAVLGFIHPKSYRVFLPPHEVGLALEEVFATAVADPFSEAFYISHAVLEWIHPLKDGNGRCARMFLTIACRSHGIPILIDSGNKTLSFTGFKRMLSRQN